MADESSLVASERFQKDKDLAASVQEWYRGLDIASLKSMTTVLEGSAFLRIIVVYE